MQISGETVLNFLTGKNSIIDGKLLSICVQDAEEAVSVVLEIAPRPGASFKYLKLIFEQVSEFEFSHRSEYVFGNIEALKLSINADRQFYLSVDPDLSSEGPSDQDRDYVISKGLTAEVAQSFV